MPTHKSISGPDKPSRERQSSDMSAFRSPDDSIRWDKALPRRMLYNALHSLASQNMSAMTTSLSGSEPFLRYLIARGSSSVFEMIDTEDLCLLLI
jgi:hypothetical protein